MINNRMWNAKNPFQGDFKKVLCVCSAGLLRSPTLAWVLSNKPFNFNTRAAGSSRTFALVPVDEVLLSWADLVVFVNRENEEEVNEHFEKFLMEKDFLTLAIPDNFEYRDPQLVKIIEEQVVEGLAKLKYDLTNVKKDSET
jgi:predicted protein tyrosine phosphatase